MTGLVLACPAKINLFLELHGRRPDGFHELATLMVPVDLCDTLRIRPARKFSVHTRGVRIAGTNTVEKAYRAVARRRRIPPVRIDLEKKIPPGAGLGGGSSNAAATLLALDRLFSPGLDLPSIAAEVGSDVPFFLHGKPALCTGRGEQIHLLPETRPLNFALFFPPVEALTAEVYATTRVEENAARKDVGAFLRIFRERSLREIRGAVFNRLEEPALRRYPLLREWKRKLGKGTNLTGSGSTFFQIHDDPRSAARVARDREGIAVSTISPSPASPAAL